MYGRQILYIKKLFNAWYTCTLYYTLLISAKMIEYYYSDILIYISDYRFVPYTVHALFSSYYGLLSPIQYLHVDSPMESNDSNRKVMQALTTASVLRNY